jgi:hypothetical protein
LSTPPDFAAAFFAVFVPVSFMGAIPSSCQRRCRDPAPQIQLAATPRITKPR